MDHISPRQENSFLWRENLFSHFYFILLRIHRFSVCLFAEEKEKYGRRKTKQLVCP